MVAVEDNLEPSNMALFAEVILRVVLGWRMLISGLSNIRRWPNPVNTARILFPKGTVFFGGAATFLMVVGGFGLAAGIQTPICAVMIIIFLVPTFFIHSYWLKALPALVPVVQNALVDDKARSHFRTFDRQAYHAHEVGIRDNLVLVAAAVYFAARGSAAYGIDNLFADWVIRFF
jgi:uncharacterized membrane protein YphA (DoxX/SURF4 family)